MIPSRSYSEPLARDRIAARIALGWQTAVILGAVCITALVLAHAALRTLVWAATQSGPIPGCC